MAVTPANRNEHQAHPDAVADRRTTAESAGYIAAMLAVVLATWLATSSFVLSYPPSDPRTDAFLNEGLVAIALAATAIGRMLSPTSLPKLTLAQAVLSGWLIAAPHVVGYGDHIPAATTNALLCGIAGILLAGYALAFAERRDYPAN